jgi:D-serine dehydratase
VDLASLEASLIDGSFKGMPAGVKPFPLGEIGAKGWNILREDLPLPVALLKQSALSHNSRWMRRFLELTGAKICPHGKTTMAPQLYQQQLNDGAWGITLATVGQVQIARRYGVRRILLANQLVGRQALQYIVREVAADPQFDFYCLVDSLAGVELLAAEARRQKCPRPVQVLVEGGVRGARCGCRDVESALDVARAAKQNEPHVCLRGVEGFEGIIRGDTPEAAEEPVSRYLAFLVEIARRCDEERLVAEGPMILTAGGSGYYDLVVRHLSDAKLSRGVDVIIRSGCYLSHDSGTIRRLHERLLARSPEARTIGEPPRAALEVWAYVQSRPEPTRAILTLGKRDCSFDDRLPMPERWFRPGMHEEPQPLAEGHEVGSLNDQHALVDLPADSPLAVGDMVACGISHPCTTFDRWQLLPVVDDVYNVVAAVRTFF